MDFNPRTSQIFNSLSPLMQETILQSGVKFRNEDDIKQFIESGKHKDCERGCN